MKGTLYRAFTEGNVNLSNYMDGKSHLFTIIGVFSAITVYLTTLSNELIRTEEFTINLGAVASLVIVIILSIHVNLSLVKRVFTETPRKELPFLHLSNADVLIFLFLFDIIIGVIAHIALSIQNVASLFIHGLFVLFGFYVGTLLLIVLLTLC